MLKGAKDPIMGVFLSLAGREVRTSVDDFMWLGVDEPGTGKFGNDPAFREVARQRSKQLQSLPELELCIDIQLNAKERETLGIVRELGRNVMAAGFEIAIFGHIAVVSLEEPPATARDAFLIANLNSQETIIVDTPALESLHTLGNLDLTTRTLFADIDRMLTDRGRKLAAMQRRGQSCRHTAFRNRMR